MTADEVLSALRVLAEFGYVAINPPNIVRQTYEVHCNSKFGSSNIHGFGDTVDAAILDALVNKTAARLAGGDEDQLLDLEALNRSSQPSSMATEVIRTMNGIIKDMTP